MKFIAKEKVSSHLDGITYKVAFNATDRTPLSGHLFLTHKQVNGTIIMAGATGVAQRFYRRFAKYTNQKGYHVLTFDYRGIGESKSQPLEKMNTTYLDWGMKDLTGAIDATHNSEHPLYLVGHSFGGHALGMTENHHLLTGAYTFGSGSGWAGWMKTSEAIKVKFLWNIILPIIVRWKGYMAWSLLGMGEDLPLGIYKNWKRWCRYPAYFFNDEKYEYLKSKYAQVEIPYVSATSTDDLWAPPKSRDSFSKHYTGCDLELKDIKPEGNSKIGHMGYFKSDVEHLWEEVFDWFHSLRIKREALKPNRNKIHSQSQH